MTGRRATKGKEKRRKEGSKVVQRWVVVRVKVAFS